MNTLTVKDLKPYTIAVNIRYKIRARRFWQNDQTFTSLSLFLVYATSYNEAMGLAYNKGRGLIYYKFPAAVEFVLDQHVMLLEENTQSIPQLPT